MPQKGNLIPHFSSIFKEQTQYPCAFASAFFRMNELKPGMAEAYMYRQNTKTPISGQILANEYLDRLPDRIGIDECFIDSGL